MTQEHMIPPSSALSAEVEDHQYTDSFSAPLNRTDTNPSELIAAFFNAVPSWVDRLMVFRNWLVSFFGLKGGSLHLSTIQPPFAKGQQLGVFKILAMNENEIVMGEQDKHLDFKTSLLIERGHTDRLVISTIVKTHNLLGKTYLLIVIPFHRIIARTLIKRMAKRLSKNGV